MSHIATNWAWRQRGLTPLQRLILLGLADHHSAAGECFVDLNRLAALCDINRVELERQLTIMDRKLLIQCLTFTGLQAAGSVSFRLLFIRDENQQEGSQ